MSKGVAVKTTVELFVGVLVLVILVFLIMKIPSLGDWIINSLKGFLGKPGTTSEELGIALNSMEALRFAIDVVANDGKVPTAMIVASNGQTQTTPPDKCVDEDFSQYGNKEVDVTEKMKAVGQDEGKNWILKIGSVRGSTTCAGTTKDDCGKRTDEVIVNSWKDGIEQQRIQCGKDKKWYWVTFNAELKEKTTSTGTTTSTQCSDITDDSKCWDTSGCKWQPTNNPNCDLNTGKGCCISSSTSSTGSFIYILKNKITGMVAAGEKDDGRGCVYTESAGVIEASCKHKDSRADPIKIECSGNPISCNIIGFELSQQIDENSAQDWILGYGDPNLLGYWQKFPEGEATSWEGYMTWETDAGLVIMWGIVAADILRLTGSQSKAFVGYIKDDSVLGKTLSKIPGKKKKLVIATEKNDYNFVQQIERVSEEEYRTTFNKLPETQQQEVARKLFGIDITKNKVAGGAAGAAAIAAFIDNYMSKYTESYPKGLVLRQPGKKIKTFQFLSNNAADSIIVLERGLSVFNNPTSFYLASPCKVDLKIERGKYGCGEKTICCFYNGNFVWAGETECTDRTGLGLYIIIPADDSSCSGTKPPDTGYKKDADGYILCDITTSSTKVEVTSIVVKDSRHDYTDKNYENSNFCYTTMSGVGMAALVGSWAFDIATLASGQVYATTLRRVGITVAGAFLATESAQVSHWPQHFSRAWN